MSLPPRSNLAWPDEIAAEAVKYMNATAVFYDSEANELIETIARVQHLRSPLESSSGQAWGTKRAVRLQIPLDADTGLIRKGLLVQLSDGAEPLRDPTLGLITLVVQSAVNSSHAALRTVECITELAETERAPVSP